MVVLLGRDVSGSAAELAGAGMVLLASFCFAVAALVYKRSFEEAEPIGVVFAMLALAALLVAPPALAALPGQMPSAEAIGAIVVLGLANTGIGFWLFYVLIDRAGAGKASLITYAIPGVATLLGIGLLGEQFGAATWLGLALILGGSWLASGGRLPAIRRRAPTPER